MFFVKNRLSKKYMRDKYSNYDRESVYANKTNFTKFLNDIEEEFYNHDFLRDDRYVCIETHKHLIQEMNELYWTKEQCDKNHYDICPTKWCLDSLLQMIFNRVYTYPSTYNDLINCNKMYLNKTYEECKKIFDSYNDEEIISLNERDYIMHGINMIKDSLDKCDENLEWKEKKLIYVDDNKKFC